MSGYYTRQEPYVDDYGIYVYAQGYKANQMAQLL